MRKKIHYNDISFQQIKKKYDNNNGQQKRKFTERGISNETYTARNALKEDEEEEEHLRKSN